MPRTKKNPELTADVKQEKYITRTVYGTTVSYYPTNETGEQTGEETIHEFPQSKKAMFEAQAELMKKTKGYVRITALEVHEETYQLSVERFMTLATKVEKK